MRIRDSLTSLTAAITHEERAAVERMAQARCEHLGQVARMLIRRGLEQEGFIEPIVPEAQAHREATA